MRIIHFIFVSDTKDFLENKKIDTDLSDGYPKICETIAPDSEYTIATSQNNTVNNIELFEEKIPTKYLKPSLLTNVQSNFSYYFDELDSAISSTNVCEYLFILYFSKFNFKSYL